MTIYTIFSDRFRMIKAVINSNPSLAPILLLALILFLALLVQVVDGDGQCLYLLVVAQPHLLHELGKDEIDDGISQRLIACRPDLPVACHHPKQFLAFVQSLTVECPQNGGHLGVRSMIEGKIVVEGSSQPGLQGDDFFLIGRALAPCEERGDLGRVDFIDLAGDEEECGRYQFVIFVCKAETAGQTMQVGHCQVLGISGHFLSVGEDPLHGQLPQWFVGGVDGVGGRGGVGEAGQGGGLLQEFEGAVVR